MMLLFTLWQRNTSTDVEKTALKDVLISALEKHLHGRGEDYVVS